MSWQTKVEQREYQVENGTEFKKISRRSEVRRIMDYFPLWALQRI